MKNSSKSFLIGISNACPATKFGKSAVKDWYDFGCTIVCPGFYDLCPNDKEAMIEILDECEKYNIKIIFKDRRVDFKHIHDEDYDEVLKGLMDDFGDHPAIAAFYLGDEPSSEKIEDAIATVKNFREKYPNNEPFMNLLPWVPWSVKGDPVLIAENQENHKEHIIDFIKRSGLTFWGYDCYFQFCGRDGTSDDWLNAYFKNLSIYSEAAVETNTTLYYTCLAAGHGHYRCPNKDEFRWQISTSVAHGVNGLGYFFFAAEPYNFNYRNHPINQFNERTQTFEWISTENRIFQMMYGTLFTELTLDRVWHINKAYGDTPIFGETDDEYIKSIRSINEKNQPTPVILSRFIREGDPDKYYYALVNNTMDECVYIYADFAKDVNWYGIRQDWEKVQPIPNPEIWKNVYLSEQPTHYEAGKSRRFACSPGHIWVFAIGK